MDPTLILSAHQLTRAPTPERIDEKGLGVSGFIRAMAGRVAAFSHHLIDVTHDQRFFAGQFFEEGLVFEEEGLEKFIEFWA